MCAYHSSPSAAEPNLECRLARNHPLFALFPSDLNKTDFAARYTTIFYDYFSAILGNMGYRDAVSNVDYLKVEEKRSVLDWWGDKPNLTCPSSSQYFSDDLKIPDDTVRRFFRDVFNQAYGALEAITQSSRDGHVPRQKRKLALYALSPLYDLHLKRERGIIAYIKRIGKPHIGRYDDHSLGEISHLRARETRYGRSLGAICALGRIARSE